MLQSAETDKKMNKNILMASYLSYGSPGGDV